jgi:hypothetical protein
MLRKIVESLYGKDEYRVAVAKMDKLIASLRKRAKTKYYENFGQKEIRDFEDWLGLQAIEYSDKAELMGKLYSAVDEISPEFKKGKYAVSYSARS